MSQTPKPFAALIKLLTATVMLVVVIVVIVGLLKGGGKEHATSHHASGKGVAEAAFRHALVGAAGEGGLEPSLEDSCNAKGGHWVCAGWIVVLAPIESASPNHCVYLEAAITATGLMGQRRYKERPIGAPSLTACGEALGTP